MKITITGRKIELTEGLKVHIEKKFAKMDRYFGEDADARVTLSVEKDRQKVEATIHSADTIYRVEEITSDMYNTIDKTIDAIERQIRKHKTRLERRLRTGSLDFTGGAVSEPVEEEKEFNVVKRKEFNTKPMTTEEAVLQMNLLGHQFFIYKDDGNKPNIVYKRKDGNYGLIEIK